MNAIITAYKPPNISSNNFLSKLKYKYGIKKAGFSGTLDPFAKGCLVVAFCEYTKLLPYLKLTPKTYIATLWLGAKSASLDTELIESIDIINIFNENTIKNSVESLLKVTSITPPKFCAKWINGKRAYELARDGTEFELKDINISVTDAKLVAYRHPFVTFSVTASKGTYVRTLGKIIAESIGVEGSLCSLERICEGALFYKNEIPENIFDILDLTHNKCFKDSDFILNGKKLSADDFEIKEFGTYICVFESFFSIIRIDESGVHYLLNAVKRG